MANQPEISEFTEGVYQYETTDPIEGGLGGKLNLPWLQLSNRTRWLKNQVNTINDFIQNIKFLVFLRKGTFFIGDVGSNDFRTVTFPTVGTSNYMVVGSIVSNGNGVADSEVTFAIKNRTATSFQIYLGEQGTPVQNVSFDYTLIPF